MNLIELGTPGAGKGTQAELLAKHFGLEHISSGDLLRQEALKNTPRGMSIRNIQAGGGLVSDDIVVEVISDEIGNTPGGFILDGVPRTLSQAQQLDRFFSQNGIPIKHVLYYYLPDDIAIQRLLKRAEHSGRSDDDPSVLQNRLNEYHTKTEPIVDYYRERGKLIELDARPSIDEIFQETLKKLGQV